MKKFLNIILLIWQAPQYLAGYASSRAWKTWFEKIDNSVLSFVQKTEKERDVKIYVVTKESHDSRPLLRHIASHSSGKYICVVFEKDQKTFETCIAHELGHASQSKDWGWLYLPVIGTASVCRNIRCQITGDWSNYFKGFPENDADRRMGIVR